MKRKIKCAIFCMILCWIVALVQLTMTRFYVNHNNVTQAFARNQLVLDSTSTKLTELPQKGGTLKGHLSGQLSEEQQKQLVSRLFHTWGGTIQSEQTTENYYVAYGYTSGISFYKKINGERINLNIAITYHEIADETTIYLGIPLLTTDF